MKRFLMLILAIVMIFTVSGCKKNITEDKITDLNFQNIEEKGIMKVGIVASKEPPMAFVNEDYNIVGFDMDLAKEIGEYINENQADDKEIRIQFEAIKSADRQTALENGAIDILVDGCVYAENDSFLYSDGYIKNRTVAVADKKYKSMGELKNLKVAVMGGEDVILKLRDAGVEDVLSYNDVGEMFKLLEEKQADALVMSDLTYLYYINSVYGKDSDKAEEIFASDIGFENEIFAVAARKDAKSVIAKVNEALKALRENKGLNEISDKWFATDACLNLQEN